MLVAIIVVLALAAIAAVIWAKGITSTSWKEIKEISDSLDK